MPLINLKLTYKQRRNFEAGLAYVYLTGKEPARIHFCSPLYYALRQGVKMAEEWAAPLWDGCLKFYEVRPDFLPLAEAHPMTQAYLWAKSNGWAIDSGYMRTRRAGANTLQRGIPLIRWTDEGRKEEGIISISGEVRQYTRDGRWLQYDQQVIFPAASKSN